MFLVGIGLPVTADEINLVRNGSFEESVNIEADELFKLIGGTRFYSGGNEVTDWEIVEGTVDYIGTYWQPSDGQRSIEVPGEPLQEGSIRQSFSTESGKNYKLLFDLAGCPTHSSTFGFPVATGCPEEQKLTVKVGSELRDFDFKTTRHDANNMGWTEESLKFTAQQTQTTLTFTGHNSALDNVRVFQVVSEDISSPINIDDIAPAECKFYAVNDKGKNQSQFVIFNVDSRIEKFEVRKLGPLYDGYDIEGLAISTENYRLYAISGRDTTDGKSRGHLYLVDAKDGELFPIGATGFKEVDSLAFTDDGRLWGWAKEHGLITIDVTTGQGTLKLSSDIEVEDLTVAPSNELIVYGAANTDLWRFKPDTNSLSVVCDNLPGETESLEMLTDSLLLLGVHKGKRLKVFDVNTCEVTSKVSIPTGEYDDIEGIAILPEECPLGMLLEKVVELPLNESNASLLPFDLISYLPKGYLRERVLEFIAELKEKGFGNLTPEKIQMRVSELQREFFQAYIDGLPNDMIKTFLDETLKQEMTADYPKTLLNDVMSKFPPEFQAMFRAEYPTVEESLKNNLLDTQAELIEHYELYEAMFPPGLIPADMFRNLLGNYAGNMVDNILLEQSANKNSTLNVLDSLPGYILDSLLENY